MENNASLKITDLTHDPKKWDDFVISEDFSLFVQSSHYADFYRLQGEKAWIIGIEDGGKLVGGSVVVSTHARRGNFLYLPYGPIIKNWDSKIFAYLIEAIKKIATDNHFDFVRVSPYIDNTEKNRQFFCSEGFKKAPLHILAETTWILDLNVGESELLINMNKNHRNLIRRSEKEGVHIEISDELSRIKEFNDLHDFTAKKHKFTRFPKKYIENEFASFAKSHESKIIFGYLPNKTLDSAAVCMFYGNTACYRHGASLNLDKHIPTSYLVQWHAILEAKRLGMKWYNFWGIAPQGANSKHPFFGLSHFKRGFGGFEKDLLPCHDLPITKKYAINWIVESIRKLRRGF